MKIALISDIHANLPALDAVISDIQQQQIEIIWNAGDLVGYGAFPEQVIHKVRSLNILSIIGNYDLKVLRFTGKANKWAKRKRSEKFIAFKWAYEHLSEDSLTYLRNLPRERRLVVNQHSVLITHASPASNEEHLGPTTDEARFVELTDITHSDLVICGHSHQPFCRQVKGVWFINPGSVGRPDDGDPRASYAMLKIKSSQVEVTHYRLEYDISLAVEEIRRARLPELFAQMLIQGKNLDQVSQ